MKLLIRAALFLAALALAAALAACDGKQQNVISEVQSVDPPETSSSLPEASGAEFQGEPVPQSEYDAYLKKYLAPYGTLKLYGESWTDPRELGADLVFQFALQKELCYYISPLDYSLLYGEEFVRAQVPESWFDSTYGCVYPQDLIENAAVEYFGLEPEFMRTAKAYVPARSGYAVLNEEDLMPQAEQIPVITEIARDGIRAAITFELYACDEQGQAAGQPLSVKQMLVEDKTESFRYVSVVNHV